MDDKRRFENDVKMYGTQAEKRPWRINWMFENDVKMYGTQAKQEESYQLSSLRMM